MARTLLRKRDAASAVEDARAVLGRWRDRLAEAQRDLAALVVTDEMLDDSEAASRLLADQQAARARIQVAEQTLVLARGRVREAELAFVAAEVRRIVPGLSKARAALEEFDRRTEELKATLSEHTGGPGWVWRDPQPHEPFAADKRVPLANRVSSLERAEQALTLAAQGVDPFVPDPAAGTFAPPVPGLVPADLPASVWGPDAVVPLAHYDRSVSEQTQRRQQHQDALQQARADLATAEERAATLRRRLEDDDLHDHVRRELQYELSRLAGDATGPQEAGSSIPEMRALLANLEQVPA